MIGPDGREWRTIAINLGGPVYVDPDEVLAFVSLTEDRVTGEGPVVRGQSFQMQWRWPGGEWRDQ